MGTYHIDSTKSTQRMGVSKLKPQARCKSKLTRARQQWRIMCRLAARDQRWMIENMPAMAAGQDFTHH